MKRLFLALVLLCPMGAVAEFYVGNEIQGFCVGTGEGESNRSVSKYNICVMYLAGLSDAASTLSAWDYRHKKNGSTPPASCGPKGRSQEQLRQVWLNDAKAHPEDLHLDASSLALNAFEEAWPCKRKGMWAAFAEVLTRDSQTYLNLLGYDAGPADGEAGPRTVEAARAFQRDMNVPPTGKIDWELSALLKGRLEALGLKP
jgi:hypothetical protein